MASLLTFCLALEGFLSIASAADIKFRKDTLHLGKEKITVELAETSEQQEHGLMFRKKLGENEGMLFVFPEERTLGFWMKNTFIDLAIGYFDAKKKLIDVQEMKAAGSLLVERPPTYPSKAPAMYALEVRSGWFDRHKIKTGETFVLGENAEGKKSGRRSGH